ncbi:MAG TPA: TIGR03118 family protein [Bryobacteraceae bacterium]|jgi:uncharacterized protein (TIGR03118 family)|nr:TIGR03118 family protein [Bryobacteraceae bacterium]
MKPLCLVSTLTLLLVAASPSFADNYSQLNLVSDIPGMAAVTDPNLKDPWGMSFSPTSPIWVSDRATGVSTLYNGLGAITPLVVAVPPGAPAGPTGQVFAGGTAFRLGGSPVNFIFSTLGGTIDAWNSTAGTTAAVMNTTSGASYTGLALLNNTLYAADFTSGGGIKVFDSSFAPTTVPGGFTDSSLPSGYAPFNVQAIGGKLYVEYAQVTPGVPVATGGSGYVDVFDGNGNLLQRLVSNGPLSGPWGITLAPSGFGMFGGDLLVGNFVNGEINAFDPATGAFLGTLVDAHGTPFVNSGLWALAFDLPNGAPGALNPNELFFTAGPNGGNDGLFGAIESTPEPAAWGLAALGILGLFVLKCRRAGLTPSAGLRPPRRAAEPQPNAAKIG